MIKLKLYSNVCTWVIYVVKDAIIQNKTTKYKKN